MQHAIRADISRFFQHPLNLEIYKGTLNKNIFQNFIEQDKIYLKAYAKVLNHISTRLQRENQKKLFRELSYYISQTELKLLDKYLARSPAMRFFSRNECIKISVETSEYINYLLNLANDASVEESVAGVIPCFTIYSELGQMMQEKGVLTSNPYFDWINSYASPKFLAYAKRMAITADEIAEDIDIASQQNMINAYVKAAHYELLFWDGVYKTATIQQNDLPNRFAG
ncbi:TenA family protein [Legionella londiniensis]|nr:TenA family protein [Legionella londiniensis]